MKFEDLKNDAELRDYLIKITFEIVERLKTDALKKGNIRKPPIANAKNGQYRIALESIKILNNILKDKEINDLELRIRNIEQGLIKNNTIESLEIENTLSEEVLNELNKLEIIKNEY